MARKRGTRSGSPQIVGGMMIVASRHGQKTRNSERLAQKPPASPVPYAATSAERGNYFQPRNISSKVGVADRLFGSPLLATGTQARSSEKAVRVPRRGREVDVTRC